MGKKSPDEKSINCHNCRHFFITYDPLFPYGCRVIGFKSRDLPSVVVSRDSGAQCRSYSTKKKK
ncbi:MAG: uracil-DNA glycosylase [Deltaproteobacteria bacterium]|nr:uracil-DNA glycosylase [Deltaproteobacteria bacterium]